MSDRAFEIEPRNKFAEATRAIVEYEIRPGNTVSFAAEIDLTEVERLRASAGARPGAGRKPSYTAFVVKALALALRDVPYANRRVCRRAWWPFGARLQRFHHCDVAVAVERDFPGSEATAFIDTVRDADAASLAEITDALHALAESDVTTNKQWREFSGVITRLPLWLSTFLIRLPCFVPSLWVKWRGAAALVSSPAKYGVDAVVGTWSHPVGVSFGLVKPRPVVVDGQVVARTTFTLTLNFDRRVMAGAQAARFFRRIVERLERAETELAPLATKGSTPHRPAPEGATAARAPEG
jgi:pyruvate/2-oxoglutarate dehydrogenase complex dihydrolipoamide acyltransferase (E2) component